MDFLHFFLFDYPFQCVHITLGSGERGKRAALGVPALVAQSELLIYGNTSAVIVKIKWLPECVVSGQEEHGLSPGVTTTKPDAQGV